MTMELASGEVTGLTRTGLEIKRITDAWRTKANGARFTEALVTFLGSKPNKGTQRVYGFAITEFFNWYRGIRGFYPTPNEVKRSEAALYVKWLRERGLGLDDARLAQDPDRQMDLEIYKFIKSRPECRISEIRQMLLRDPRFTTRIEYTIRGTKQLATVLTIEAGEPRGDALQEFIDLNGHKPDSALDLRLACLCMHNLLRRTPTIAQIREHQVDIGISNYEQAQITFRVDPEIFRYFANEYTEKKGGDRAGTIATKLAALSSFWGYLVKSTAENMAGYDQLLQFNIWRDALQDVRATAINRAKAHRESATPDRELFIRVLSSTFVRSHGKDAIATAEAALEGADVSEFAVAMPTIYDLRDRAILIFCYWTGIRAEELGSLRRTELDFKTGLLPITGKGDQTRIIRVADPALRAVEDFQVVLAERAGAKGAYLFSKFLADPEAPLFPPLKLWGRAARITPTRPEDLPGISPSGLARMLHERAGQVGIEEGSDDYYRVHPHGLRHLAALEANRRGVDVATIQATLGHGSLSTTGIYLEVRDPMRRSLQPDQPPPRKEREVPTFEAEAEVTGEASSAGVRPTVVTEAGKRLGAAAQASERKAETPKAPPPAAEKPKRRVVSGEQPKARDVATAAAEAAKAARIAAEAANAAAKAAASVSESMGGAQAEVIIEPIEFPETGTVVITPPEEEMVQPTEVQIEHAASPDTIRVLLAVYDKNWGQAGKRSHLAEQVKGAEKGLVTQVYVGERTSLGWWAGTTGKMSGPFHYKPNMVLPAMPVLAPEQFSAGFPDNNALANELAVLYEKWADEPERGFTAANALLRWIRLAAEVTESCDEIVEKRAGFWIPVDAPLVTTSSDSVNQWKRYAKEVPDYDPLAEELERDAADKKKRSVVLAMRAHLTGAIVAWFESTAWQWRPSEKSGDPTGDDWDPPNWYSEPDPLASMEDQDRSDLLEWLRVLTGRAPADKTPRFDGVSRAQIGKILDYMCQYESEQKFSADVDQGRVRLSKEAKDTMKIWDAEIQKLVSAATKGRVKGFSYSTSKQDRKKDRDKADVDRERAKRKAEDELASGDISENELREKSREIDEQHAETFKRMLSGHFLSVIAGLFGKEAAEDPWLKTQALCSQGLPFADGEYKEFFQVKGQTIQHDLKFADDFAHKWGQHSECLARRLARHLWEESRFDYQSEQKRGWLNDTALNAYRLYRVPCPSSQEQDLRNMIGSPTKLPVFEEFQRAGKAESKLSKEAITRAAMRMEIEKRTGAAAAEDIYHGSFAPEGYNENRRKGPGLPNPVRLIFASNLIRRAQRS